MTAPILSPLRRTPEWLARWPRLTALVAGAVSATGFAPLGLWPLTLFALALLLWLIEQAPTTRRAFAVGWLWGVGHFAVGLNWIATAFTYQAAMPAWLGWVAVLLLSLYLALYPALAAAGAWWGSALRGRTNRHSGESGTPTPDGAASDQLVMDPRLRGDDTEGEGIAMAVPNGLTLLLLFAALWIITEWLRSWVFTGFAWNPLAASAVWAAFPAEVIGTYGQSGLTILAAASVLLLCHRRWPDLGWLSASFAVMLATMWLASGLHLFLMPSSMLPTERNPTPVTIVQPNIEQGDKWDLAQRRVNFAKLARLTPRRYPGEARLVLWPEAAVPDYLEDGYPLVWYDEAPALVRARLAGLLGPGDLLLTGAVRLEPNASRTDIDGARNSLFVLDANGRIGPRYDKAHLVPYGEYLPMRGLLEPLGLSRLAPGAVDFWAGPGARTLDLGRFGKVGVQICYEIIFSGQVVDRANRPDFIFNPSNDAWFGSWGPPQHLAQAQLRAIEEGLPVVRATPTGISAIIDADGHIVESIGMGRAGRIDANLPPAREPTLFARYGNAIPVGIALFILLWQLAPLALRRWRR